jgi:Tfp pilus assembly protein PilZ
MSVREDPLGRRARARRRHLAFVLYATRSVCGEGHLANVSEEGLFVRTDEAPKIGEHVRIELCSSGAARIVLEGEVRWTSVERQRVQAGFGVRLESPPQAYLRWLRETVLKRRGRVRNHTQI